MPKQTLLTDRQQDIYGFICKSIKKHSYSPTVREIAGKFGIRSPNGVMCHLIVLEKKGMITRRPGEARGIQVVAIKGVRCPVCGAKGKE